MKHEKQMNAPKHPSGVKAAFQRLRLQKLICVVLGSCLLAVGLYFGLGRNIQAKALAIPSDYGTGYEVEQLDNVANEQSFAGILCKDKANKVYTLTFSDAANGLVTLARISQNGSLDGYTFEIALGGAIELGVNYENDDPISGDPISDGSFFGIGNDTYPFKGKIVISGAADTSIAIKENGWRFLFNNLSNEAQIVTSGNYCLYSSYPVQDENTDTFVFCRTLTVTKQDGALDISGFRFGASNSGALVRGDGLTAVFAGEVKAGGASSFSVDLSKSLTSGTYIVESSADDAGGLIADIGAGVTATIGLPDSLTFEVKAGGVQKNAGSLVGSNYGNVTFSRGANWRADADAFTLKGAANATGSAGLIGANQDGSQATFTEDISAEGLKASGLRAGGLAGTCFGPLTVRNVRINNAAFTGTGTDTAGRLGGAVGSIDRETGKLIVAPDCTVSLSSNTFTAAKDCYIGGYIGYWKTSDANQSLDQITLSGTNITAGGNAGDRIGGYIGSLTTTGNFSIALGNNVSFTFQGISAGICGGVIGEVNSDLPKTVLLEGNGVSGKTILCTVNNSSVATVGGLVGKVSKGYLKINNLSVDNNINRTGYAADLAGSLADGAVLDIGNLSLVEAKGSVLVAKTGQGSVVRLNGNIKDTSGTVQNLVYEQNASLIYLEDGCTYSANPSTKNDIGNYGQVVRNDTLRQVIRFSEDTHTVSLDSPLNASGDIAIADERDFAKLAITFHTKGAISGVTGAAYSALFGKTVNLTGDSISLENTGIEQLTPANDITRPFTGTLNGNGKTVTLAIGQNIFGTNDGVQAGANNARSSLGLFACLNGAEINEITVNGKIALCLPDANQYVGSLAGKSDGSLLLNQCQVGTAISVADGLTKKTNSTSLYVGGAVGYIGNAGTLSATGCALNANISDSTNASVYTANLYKPYLGGLSGYVSYTGSQEINFQDNVIGTTVQKGGAYADLKIGGLIGELKCSNYVTVNLRGTTAQNVNLTATAATGSVGGILGHTFDKCHVILNDAYSGTVKAGSASLGGLLYTMNGRLTVENGFTVTGTNLTATGPLRGLLLADGKTALVTVLALPGGFDGVTATGFDLFVGKNIQSYTSVNVAASGGIVTVETGDALGKLPQNSDWYALIDARPNTKTRYYFNIAGLENKGDASETVKNESALLYWHVFDYAQVLPHYVRTAFFKTSVNNIVSVTADIDMTDYCFYPTKKESVAINFKGYKLTFGKTASVNAAYQFFGLQAGLLSDIDNSGANAAVQISNIKLGGQVSFLGNELGSGALICGTVRGSNVNNTQYDAKMTLSNITLSGLTVDTDAIYRPMLVNRIASYVEATVSGVWQEGYAANCAAASSLIGRGGILEGSTPSSYIRMTLNNIVLDGKKSSSVFTKATLFYDVLYVSGSGSFIYNFTFSEDWGDAPQHQVTYGVELYLNEDQQEYYNQSIHVNPDTKPTETTGIYDFRGYLPYVYIGYDSANGKINLNLSVNRKGADFIEGFGTYGNPYIIRSAKQLEYLAKLLSVGSVSFNDGWQINFPRGVWSNVASLDLTDYYQVQATGEVLQRVDDTSVVLSRELLLDYLSGAYFKLSDDASLTLSSEYAGLGSTAYPFHGVIHGNARTVTMSATDAIGSYGYGFINVANGCVVYDLTIHYGSIVLSSNDFSSTDTATTGPNAATLSTSLPHFGGAIAWVVGGDNLLQNVTVTAVSVTPGACHTVCGGYVGLISGGGVLLDTLTPVTEGRFNSGDHLYHNNYVGRVLNGYAIAIDGNVYTNSKVLTGLDSTQRADFIIPSITKATLTGHNRGFSGNAFDLETAEELLLFSFGMNSGAFTGNTGYAYGNTSLSRYGDYAMVGTANPAGVTNGKYTDDDNRISILASYFNVTADLRNTNVTVTLSGTEYDMRAYGNAFRGMSGVYGDSPIYKISVFGAGADQTATVRLEMDMLQYAAGQKTNNTDTSYFEADSIRRYGLFGSLSNAVTFQNLVVTGRVSVTCINRSNVVMVSNPFAAKAEGNGCSVGGLLGRSNGGATLTNVALQDMTVTSPDICGGFVGQHMAGNLSVSDSGCAYRNATVKGKRHTGGVAGYVGNGDVSVTGLTAADSVVETRVDLQYATGTLYGTAGGVFGYVGSKTASITLTDCAIAKTAVVYAANYKNTGDYVASGGLVGISEKSLTANHCTVDGCVILAVSNFSGGSKFPDTLTPQSDSLPAELRNHLVYNGTNQNAANLLAWMLEQTAGNTAGYSVGAAGGLLGQVRSGNITLTDCTVSSDCAPTLIAAFNNAGGLVGEQRGTASVVTVTNCAVKTVNHDMYILGAPRAAGILAYRDKNGTGTCTVNRMQVVGTAAHPVRILGYMYSPSDAGGLFADLNSVRLTAADCRVSYCIIGGVKAGGVSSTVNAASPKINLTDIEVSNNLIYSQNNRFYAGGLFCEAANGNNTFAVDGAYVGKNCIVSQKGAGGLVGQLQSGNTLSAKYVILDDNVIRRISSTKVSNFTFAADSLVNAAAPNALFDSGKSGFTNVGLIAGNNNGTATAIAVSCNAPDAGNTKQKNFGLGAGTGTVVYAAYGAQVPYLEGNTTPRQAIEKMSIGVTVGEEQKVLYGDSVTLGTPATIYALTQKWWPYQDNSFVLGDGALTNLDQLVTGITVNQKLPLFCLNEKTDATVKGYMNMLTGGGFLDALDGSLTGADVESKRYRVDENGILTDLGTDGSVVFRDGKFSAGVYDNLEGDNKTLTILSVTFKDKNGVGVYTMHMAIYYHRSVNMKTFVVPLEGEQYYIPSFLNFLAEPSGSLRTNVSFGSPFTLYVEYNYNDMAMTLENIGNFYKQIELTQSNGLSDKNARIESGTAFILIDLNSATPAGYSYYTLVLDQDERFIDFNAFTAVDPAFPYIPLTDLQTLAHLSQDRVCKDSGDCVYTEKYILVVFPVHNNTDSAITYNMKAVIDEEQRQSTNIVVKRLKEVYGQVSVWGSPEVEQSANYIDNTPESTQFSNLADHPIRMDLDTTVTFANGNVTALQSQNGAVYGTHILRLRNEKNQYVELPMRTVVTVETENGDVIYQNELVDAASQIRFPVGDILKKVTANDQVEMRYRITLDFSGVSQNDFNTVFASFGQSAFTLVDSLYLSADSELLGSGPWDVGKDYTVNIETGVRLAVVPTDNRYLGINLLKPEDITNSGEIDFSVIAKFDAFEGKTFENVSVSFSVSKKVYDGGEYKYVALEEDDPLSWKIYKGDSEIGSDVLMVQDKECNGKYTLKVEESDLTNYRLCVKITATADGDTTVQASDYFVFLLCKLETDPIL